MPSTVYSGQVHLKKAEVLVTTVLRDDLKFSLNRIDSEQESYKYRIILDEHSLDDGSGPAYGKI
jgi:hypothetical protein